MIIECIKITNKHRMIIDDNGLYDKGRQYVVLGIFLEFGNNLVSYLIFSDHNDMVVTLPSDDFKIIDSRLYENCLFTFLEKGYFIHHRDFDINDYDAFWDDDHDAQIKLARIMKYAHAFHGLNFDHSKFPYNDGENDRTKKYQCLCCGAKSLSDLPPGTNEICEFCGWEDDYTMGIYPDYKKEGKLSLNEARRVLKFRTSE